MLASTILKIKVNTYVIFVFVNKHVLLRKDTHKKKVVYLAVGPLSKKNTFFLKTPAVYKYKKSCMDH